MKKKLVKALLMLSLAGTLSIGGAVFPAAGPAEVYAYKVATVTTLNTVTGIAYDPNTQRISWNKVPGATRYRIEIKDPTEKWSGLTDNYVYNLYYDFGPDSGSYSEEVTTTDEYGYTSTEYVSHKLNGTYTVTVTAVNSDELYLLKSGAVYSYNQATGRYDYSGYTWDDFDHREKDPVATTNSTTAYNLYKYPTSAPAAANVTLTDTTNKAAVTPIAGITIKEKSSNSITFTPAGSLTLANGESLYWEYSDNAEFKNGTDKFKKTEEYSYDSRNKNLEVSYNSFDPGDTIYVRARVYNPNMETVINVKRSDYNTYSEYWDAYDAASEAARRAKYSAYTPVVTATVPAARVTGAGVSATPTSIVISAGGSGGTITGYQFAKKIGSKWVTVETQTDNVYEDKGLAKNTAYDYRVRAYSYNKKTNKTLWTDWYYVNATTWGSTLDFKAAAASASSVKLTWKAITGAEGYEVYREDTDSYARNHGQDVYDENFATSKLIKTITKQKTKTYTDKGLNKLGSYTYSIRAYKTIGKQKIYLNSSSRSVSLRAGDLSWSDLSSYVNAAGKTVVTWPKKTGIKGYYVEKYDPATSDYVRVKTLKATATSNTFDQIPVGSDSIQYRIRPYDAKAVYSGQTITVYPTLAAPAGVKAAKTAEGVKITWSAVAGADYYKVYRTTSSDYSYDKTRKTYNYYGDSKAVYDAAINLEGCYPELESEGTEVRSLGTYKTTQIKGTSVEDKTLTYKTRSTDANGDEVVVGVDGSGNKIYAVEDAIYVEGPEPGFVYYYYVVAYAKDSNGAVDTGTVSSASTKAAMINYTNQAAGKATTIASVKSKKKGQVTVTVKKASGIKGYAIYRSDKKKGTYTLVGTIDAKKTSFTDTTATSKKTAYYKVATFVEGEQKANIYSAKSAPKSVKVK